MTLHSNFFLPCTRTLEIRFERKKATATHSEGERLWCIRKSLCTVHKSQHNCFLHPTQNKTKQTKRGIFNLIINTVVHHHHCIGMPKPFCCGNGFCESYSKTILLWKWFPKSSISSSTPSFIIITVPKCQNHFAVEMVSRIFNLIINTVVHHHHRTGMAKPFCCGKLLDVLNCFQQLYSKIIRCT